MQSLGQMDSALAIFDKSTTADQRQALGEILGHVFPVKWKSFQTAEGDIDTWSFDKDQAHAMLNGGKTARFQGISDEPAVLKNVRYWGTPRNDGFVMMPNELEAYREGPSAFEFKGTNGFMLTFDTTSKETCASERLRDELPRVINLCRIMRWNVLAHYFFLNESYFAF